MMNSNIDDNLATAFAFLGFFVGFYLCWTVLNTVASCVVAIFVCYAEDPNAMEINRPNDYHKLTAARNGVSQDEFEEQQQMEQQQEYNQQQQQQQQTHVIYLYFFAFCFCVFYVRFCSLFLL